MTAEVVLLRQSSRKMEDVFVYEVSNMEGSYEYFCHSSGL